MKRKLKLFFFNKKTRRISSHFNSLNIKNDNDIMILVIQVLAWDSHKHVVIQVLAWDSHKHVNGLNQIK